MSESNFKKQMNMPRVFFVGSVLLATMSLAGCGATVDPNVNITATAPVEVQVETTPIVTVNNPATTTEAVVAATSTVGDTTTQTTTKPTTTPTTTKTEVKTEVKVDVTKPVVAVSAFKDGTYRVVGVYNSPAGDEKLGVSVTLKNDVVVDTSVEQMATAGISKRMQADFAANYKTFVVGKKITDIHLTKVSGSSLTPAGFNDALVKIEAQASTK